MRTTVRALDFMLRNLLVLAWLLIPFALSGAPSVLLTDPTCTIGVTETALTPSVEPSGRLTEQPVLAVEATPDDGATDVTVRVVYTSDPELGIEQSIDLAGSGSGGLFSGGMPARGVGLTYFYFEADCEGEGAEKTRLPATGYYKYDTEVTLDHFRGPLPQQMELAAGNPAHNIYRYWDGTQWYQDASKRDESWFFYRCFYSAGESASILLQNMATAYLRSPRLEGIGTLYFKAMPLRIIEGEEHRLEIQTSPDGKNPWTTVETFVVPSVLQYTSCSVELNDYSPSLFVRIARVTKSEDDACQLGLRDIRVSPPPADVEISETSILTPGYPCKEDDITFYCHVDNVSERYPAIDIQPKLMWRRNNDPFAASNMTHHGGGDYTVTLPPQVPGKIEYYYQVDFSGTSFSHEGNDESRNPSVLGWNGLADINTMQDFRVVPTARPFTVRMFDSHHNVMELRRYDTMETTPMRLVGDELWQAVLYITNSVSMDMQFAGVLPYYEGYTEFDTEAEVFSDDEQATYNPPLTSVASMDDMNPMLVTLSDYVGTVMFRFDVASGRYEVRKAAFQDFNTWQASHFFFEESLGLLAIENYETDFETLPVSVPTGYVFTHFDQAPAMEFNPPYEPVRYVEDWRIENAWVIEERMPATNFVAGETPYANQAVRIQSGSGSVQSTAQIHTRGRDALQFKPRVAFGDDKMPYFINGFSFKNYEFKVKAQATSISPGNPTISVIVYRRDLNNFYEVRLTQNRDLTYNNNIGRDVVRYELYRCNNGVYTRIGTTVNRSGITLSNVEFDISFSAQNDAGSSVNLSATISYPSGQTPVTSTISVTEASAGILADGGTVGLNVSDAVVQFTDLQLLHAPGGNVYDNLNVPANWYLGGAPVDGLPGETLWVFDVDRISRPLRPVNYEVSIIRVGESRSMPDQPIWEVAPGGLLQVNSLAYPAQPVTVDLKTWDNTFLKISSAASDGMLVVDNLEMRDWRGLTITDPEEVPINDPASNTVWRAMEGYVTVHTGNRKVELTRSRANPVNKQMLVSPVLEDGVGTISFDYEATGGNVRFVVERASYDGLVQDDDSWEQVAPPIDLAANDSGNFYLPVRVTMIGRVRVRMDPDGCDPASTLWLDTLKVTSYPGVDDTSWKAYNALINPPNTNPETDDKQFEPENLETRSAFLNNSSTNDVSEGAFDESLPYIQSPRIDTGVGEIGFWLRAWDPEAEHPGKLKLMMAPSIDSTNWVEVTIPEDPAADAAYKQRLSNITNSVFEYFTIEIFDKDNKVLRIYSETNNASRVALDNIIVTEPVRSSIDIESVTMTPPIPLASDPVHVTVQLANPRMNPENILVKLYYYFGTNLWGYANWKDAPDRPLEIVLQPAGPQLMYETPMPIPGRPVDSVVQYQVVVTYTGTFPAPIEYDAFVNPEWYFPVDLNEQYSLTGFSPYYFVFSCPPGAVFFNEFFYAYNAAYFNREFIEIIGPQNASLKNWRVDVVDATGSAYEDDVRTSYTLPADAWLHGGEKGWGFYVLGDDDPAIADKVDYVFPDGGDPSKQPKETASLPLSGGFRLVRGMGAYVDRISYGASSIAKVNMVDRGYTFTFDRPTFGLNANRSIGLGMDDYTGDLGWLLITSNQESPGEMNPGEAVVLDEIDPYPEEGGEEPPVLAALSLEIRSIQLESGQVTVTVWADSTSEEKDLTGWIGVLETNVTPAEAGWGEVSGTETGFSEIGEYPFEMAEQLAPVFFRIKATSSDAE